jgi:hypothetical protein
MPTGSWGLADALATSPNGALWSPVSWDLGAEADAGEEGREESADYADDPVTTTPRSPIMHLGEGPSRDAGLRSRRGRERQGAA